MEAGHNKTKKGIRRTKQSCVQQRRQDRLVWLARENKEQKEADMGGQGGR